MDRQYRGVAGSCVIANGAELGDEEPADLIPRLSPEQQQTTEVLIDTYLEDMPERKEDK